MRNKRLNQYSHDGGYLVIMANHWIIADYILESMP